MARKIQKVAVLGAGSWGTAMANVLADNGVEVTVWGRDPKHIAEIQKNRINQKYLENLTLHPRLNFTSNRDEALEGVDDIVCAIPSQQIRSVFEPLALSLKNKRLLNLSKGIEEGSLMTMGELFASIEPTLTYAIVSGPSFAKEVVEKKVTALTVASHDGDYALEVQKALTNDYFRAYTSQDVIGVEWGGALKNIFAIATGMVDALDLGTNARAALIVRGMGEILRTGKAKGAQEITFLGLSGMGDLILTCTGGLSRNRQLGFALGQGLSLAQAQSQIGGVAEGYYTTQSVYHWTQAHHIEAPIIEQVYHILFQNQSPSEAIKNLMSRDPKPEFEQ